MYSWKRTKIFNEITFCKIKGKSNIHCPLLRKTIDKSCRTKIHKPLDGLNQMYFNSAVTLWCTYTNITSRMTLSKRKSSEKVLMRRSTMRKVYWTVSMDLYLARDSFMAGVECGDHCQCGDHCHCQCCVVTGESRQVELSPPPPPPAPLLGAARQKCQYLVKVQCTAPW